MTDTLHILIMMDTESNLIPCQLINETQHSDGHGRKVRCPPEHRADSESHGRDPCSAAGSAAMLESRQGPGGSQPGRGEAGTLRRPGSGSSDQLSALPRPRQRQEDAQGTEHCPAGLTDPFLVVPARSPSWSHFSSLSPCRFLSRGFSSRDDSTCT